MLIDVSQNGFDLRAHHHRIGLPGTADIHHGIVTAHGRPAKALQLALLTTAATHQQHKTRCNPVKPSQIHAPHYQKHPKWLAVSGR
ncbi:hypothetical protein KPSA1_04609 [Pseudomonas syringae pv. actinidiae]|uniref:Uncharacterized protein n=1 Tax=Pseudomonas syringae pv. actinidiae TaxID=103796 RepID=A0A2V0QDC1_PSESF|nr:hypothetical protein KPSA1_04609 [Pseudomonas syringae pv. actinidiae]